MVRARLTLDNTSLHVNKWSGSKEWNLISQTGAKLVSYKVTECVLSAVCAWVRAAGNLGCLMSHTVTTPSLPPVAATSG